MSVCDPNGAVVDVDIVEKELDLSEYINRGYEMRLFIWKDNLAPVTLPFER